MSTDPYPMSLHITKQGVGKPLVLFHGWGFDSLIWTPFIESLKSSSDNYQLFLVDLPGFGQSAYLDWEAFKQALMPQLPEKFALLGWSMGGVMATRLALEEPHRVTHLFNMASTPKFVRDTNWHGVDVHVLNSFYDRFQQNPTQTRINFIQAQLQGFTLPAQYFTVEPSLTGLSAGLALLMNWDLRDLLHKIKQPVCYVFGRLDTIIPRKTMQTMQTMYPHFQYVMIDKSAHAPFLSHADLCVQILQRVMTV